MRQLRITAFLFLVGILSASGQTPLTTASLAYVFDPGQQSVVAIDLSSGKQTATARIDGSGDPHRDLLAMTPDGSRLAVFVDGNQKSTATIIDANTMKPFPPIDLGLQLDNYSISQDNQLLTTVTSSPASQSNFSLPGEIAAINLSTGQLIKQIPIPRPVTSSLISKDGKIVVLFFARKKLPYGHFTKAELQFFDIEKQAALETISLDGNPQMPFFSPVGDLIYVLDRGKPSHNPNKNINGKIQVIPLKEMKIAQVLDAGSNPRVLLPDDGAGQSLILSDGAPVPNPNQIVDAEVRVLRGASVQKVLTVASGPKYFSFSPDKKRLYVTSTFDRSAHQGSVGIDKYESDPTAYSMTHSDLTYIGFDQLTVIDYTSLKVLGQIPLNGVVGSVVPTPDGNHGFTLDLRSSRILELDLQNLKPGTVVSTGRNGIKAEHFILGSVEASVSLFFPVASIAFSAGDAMLYSPANTLMSVRPDGAFVYVLNHDTSDVTAINTKDTSVVAKIPIGGRRLQPLTGGNILAVIGNDSINRIDTSTQKSLPDVAFHNTLNLFSLSPDGRTGVALTDGAVFLLNGKTGELQYHIDGFKAPLLVLFAPTQAGGAR